MNKTSVNDRRPGISSEIFEAERGRKPRNLPEELLAWLRFAAVGCERPRTEKEIDDALGIKKGVAREIIRNLRKKGALIASGPRGYWILGPMPSWDDTKAFLECIGSLRRRAHEIIEVTKPMGLELNKRHGQMIRSHSQQTDLIERG